MTDDTLTLHAEGPAEATLQDETDGVAIATNTEVDLDAELEIDADWLADHGHVSKRSEARLYADDVAELVCERRSGDDGTFRPLEGWSVEISGSFEAWATVAIAAAKGTVTVGSDNTVANAACLTLDGLAQHAVDDRPRLVMLDICGSYDPSDYSRSGILSALQHAAESGPQIEGEATAEAAADD
jgi:hypothetical protein